MNHRAEQMTNANLLAATKRAQRQVQSWLQQAQDVQNDVRKDERLARHFCAACFYRQWFMAGAAMTHQPCMCCGENQLYGSTRTDALCLPCATTASLCKHCGGDLAMNTHRQDWPQTDRAL